MTPKLNVVATGWLLYLGLNLDQSSLIQAQSDHFLKDLHMNTNGIPSYPFREPDR